MINEHWIWKERDKYKDTIRKKKKQITSIKYIEEYDDDDEATNQ